jgi:hypothetical protein
LIIVDPENFIKFFTRKFWPILRLKAKITPILFNFIQFNLENVWNVIVSSSLSNVPLPPYAIQQQIQLQQQQQPIPANLGASTQLTFLHQQLNLLIEIISFRLKHLTFTHRTTFLTMLNNLFNFKQQQQPQQQPQQAQLRNEQINYIKHPVIYVNTQCAMLKLLTSFNGPDYFEFLNSIHVTTKHSPVYFINQDSEEISKAVILLIARAVQLTSSDLYPLENKDKDDPIRAILREIVKTTPVYFHDYVLQYFPKLVQEFFAKEQQHMGDSSIKQYKSALKMKVDEDYKRFLDCRHETQVQIIFQNNPLNAHTLLW